MLLIKAIVYVLKVKLRFITGQQKTISIKLISVVTIISKLTLNDLNIKTSEKFKLSP